jgi:hypothetical protein
MAEAYIANISSSTTAESSVTPLFKGGMELPLSV